MVSIKPEFIQKVYYRIQDNRRQLGIEDARRRPINPF